MIEITIGVTMEGDADDADDAIALVEGTVARIDGVTAVEIDDWDVVA
jgi:hypothetical protein